MGLGTATTLAATTTSGTTTATATAPGIGAGSTTMSGGSAAYFSSLGLSNTSSRRNVKDHQNGKETPGRIPDKERTNKSTNQLPATTTSAKHVSVTNQSRSAAVSTATVTNGHSDTARSSKHNGPTQARPLAPFTSSTWEAASTFSSTPSRDHKQEIRLRREERRKMEGENFRRKGKGEEKHTKSSELRYISRSLFGF